MYSKINVKGDNIDPLWQYLLNSKANNGQPVQWNFDAKFLIDTNGKCIQRWNAKAELKTIEEVIASKL